MGEENANGEGPRRPLEEPKDGAQLREWVQRELGLKLPQGAVCPHHQSPLTAWPIRRA